MGKGSAPRPFTDRSVFEDNFDKIFRKKVNSPDVSPHAYEYELNKSTGDVEKVFKESIEQNNDILKALKDGIDKPNESQFDGN